MPKTITIPEIDYWDPVSESFLTTPSSSFTIEHSLVSLRKWEQKHKKIFLSNVDKSFDELVSYVECMCLTQNVPKDLFGKALLLLGDDINAYINDPMTALVFTDDSLGQTSSSRRDVVSYEMIHYWMIANQIPTEYSKWHLSALMSLIRVCSIKNTPAKKRSNRDAIASMAAQNKARRAKYGTKG